MQYYVYNKMKQLSTEENSNNEMIQMEFGENFTCTRMKLPEHTGKQIVLLFTLMIWF